MRPLTLKRIIEICNLALTNDSINESCVIHELNTSQARARELLFEIERIGLIGEGDGEFTANENTHTLIESFEREDWKVIHSYLLRNYSFYRDFVSLLRSHVDDEKGLSNNNMIKEARRKKLPLNRTAIEVLQNWCERLGVLQRHLYKKRFYLVKKSKSNSQEFKRTLIRSYQTLNQPTGLELRATYLEIPKLREDICEQLKMTREDFDHLFKRLYLKSIGKIELSGAPTITAAKKSPLSIRKISATKKDRILSPHLDLTKERRGIEIGGKAYYYMAIHDETL